MSKAAFKSSLVSVAVFMALFLVIYEQDAYAQPPPVGAPIVREGALAMKLAEALDIGHPSSEAEAESMLGAAGIAPRNGWMADYPVTPDVIGELRDSVTYAAQAKTISMDQGAGLKALEDVLLRFSMSISPGLAGPPEASAEDMTGGLQSQEGNYPDQTIINNYYYQEGPPVVTYYPPPPDYYYLYAWVPYPFWWSEFWFGGFFVLHDFHKHIRENGHVVAVTNHFRDAKTNRVFRVDPENRFSGRTFAGIGAPKANTFVNTGIQRAPERVFNGESIGLSGRPRGTVSPQGLPRFRSTNPFSANRVYSRPPGAGRTFLPRSSASHGSRAAGRARGGGKGTKR